MKSSIVVRGARQHNLKGFDLEIPRRTFTVITGPSGSGKSSLAFDTIYAEGQRRYVESLSAYARQFLERMEKPDVDHIEGISPAVAIEQKNPTKTSRSTVGTATEIYDFLRLLWARVGHTFCPQCGREMRPDTVQSVTDEVLALPSGTRFAVAFPLRLSDKVTHDMVLDNLRAQGFLRVVVDGTMLHLDELATSGQDITAAHELLVVVDRLVVSADATHRLADSVGTALAEGDGECVVIASELGARARLVAQEPSPPRQFPIPESRAPTLASASPSASSAHTTARRHPRRRRSSFPSTAHAERVRLATASARFSSMTRRSSFRTRSVPFETAPSIRGRSRGTKASVAPSPSSRSGAASP